MPEQLEVSLEKKTGSMTVRFAQTTKKDSTMLSTQQDSGKSGTKDEGRKKVEEPKNKHQSPPAKV